MGVRPAVVDDEEVRLAQLADRFPSAPVGELRRFLRKRSAVDAAAELYAASLRWRAGPGSPERLAAAAAAVPWGWIRTAGCAMDGSRLVLVQGARFDPAVPAEEYALACAEALDQAAPTGGSAKATILIDLRPCEGWANMPAAKMLTFMKCAARVLPDKYPDRADRFILYPMTPIVKYFWSLVSGFLDKAIRDQFVMLAGSASLGAPCPSELGEYVTLDQLPPDAHSMHEALAVREVSI